MELSEIYSRLCTLNIPVAYRKFNSPQNLPFIAYFESSARIEGADGYNLFRRAEIKVEIYSQTKNLSLENSFEMLFRDVELEKTANTYLENEDMYMTAYKFETIQKYGGK